jgi:hypothetical protein
LHPSRLSAVAAGAEIGPNWRHAIDTREASA